MSTLKPFYSIAELAEHFDMDAIAVRDGLRASGVAMFYQGEEVALDGWRRNGERDQKGRIAIIRGWRLVPDPAHVIVHARALRTDWQDSLATVPAPRPRMSRTQIAKKGGEVGNAKNRQIRDQIVQEYRAGDIESKNAAAAVLAEKYNRSRDAVRKLLNNVEFEGGSRGG